VSPLHWPVIGTALEGLRRQNGRVVIVAPMSNRLQPRR
jgi:hypothetical protein